jgi:hypothetical protein
MAEKENFQLILEGFDQYILDKTSLRIGGQELWATNKIDTTFPDWNNLYWTEPLLLNPPTFKEEPYGVSLAGMPLYADTSQEIRRGENEVFLRNLEIVRLAGGGIVIFIDDSGRDRYSRGYSDGFSAHDDRGYHYAMAGIDVTHIEDTLHGGDMNIGLYPLSSGVDGLIEYGAFKMPLPILAESMGLVQAQQLQSINDDDIRRVGKSAFSRELTMDFPQLMELFMKTFDGRVRLGLLSEWRSLHHETWSSRKLNHENEAALHDGPLIPRGWDDEERLAKFQEWLIKLNWGNGAYYFLVNLLGRPKE